jgi:hypothetical protein
VKESERTNGQPTIKTYLRMFVRRHSRPNAQMPIDAHATLSRLLKEVNNSAHQYPEVRDIVKSVRAELSEWMSHEHSDFELYREIGVDIYYDDLGPTRQLPLDRTGMISHLKYVCEVSSFYYPKCQPLGTVTAQLNRAIILLHFSVH